MIDNINFNIPENKLLDGVYSIEVYDKENNLVDYATGHNCINKALYSTAFTNFILNGTIYNTTIRNNLDGTHLSSSYGNENLDSSNLKKIYDGLCNYLLLTNSEASVGGDDTNPIIMGNIVGEVLTKSTAVSTNPLVGTMNNSESSVEYIYENENSIYPNKIKKTYSCDFATDKANGVFNNVYTSGYPINSSSEDVNYYRNQVVKDVNLSICSTNKNNLSSNSSECGSFSYSQSKKNIYIQNLSVYNESKQRAFNYDTITELNELTFVPNYIKLQVPVGNANRHSVIIYSSNLFWRIEYDWICTRYNLDGTYLDSIDLKSKLDAIPDNIRYPSSYSNYSGAQFDLFTGSDKYIYITYRTNNDGKLRLCVFDESGEKVCETSCCTKLSYGSSISPIYVNDTEYILISSITSTGSPSESTVRECTMLYKVLDNGSVEEFGEDILFSVRYKLTSWSDFPTSQIIYTKNKTYLDFVIAGDNSFLYRENIIPWTSHIKLSNPITKTSENTMKIKYTITSDYISPCSNSWIE